MFNPLAAIVAPRAFLRAFAALENLKLDARRSSVACVSLELSIAHTRAPGVTDIVHGVSTPVPVARVARARPCAADRARAGHSIHNASARGARRQSDARWRAPPRSRRRRARAVARARGGRADGRRARGRRAREATSRETRSRRRNRRRRRRNRRRRATTADAERDGRDASTSTASFVDEAFAAIGKSVCAVALAASAFAARDAASAEKFGGSVGAPTGAVWDDVERAIGSGEERDDV